jgi:acetyl-CoA synthetase
MDLKILDVINVSGHRLSTAEIEAALIQHPGVAETAVVGAADDLTGQAVYGQLFFFNLLKMEI